MPPRPNPPIFPPPRLMAAGRVLVGLSQREMAAEASLAVSAIGHYESGKRGLHARSLEAILSVFRAYGLTFVRGEGEVAAGLSLAAGGRGAEKFLELMPPPRARRTKRGA